MHTRATVVTALGFVKLMASQLDLGLGPDLGLVWVWLWVWLLAGEGDL